jgi:DNA-binding protein H-NS
VDKSTKSLEKGVYMLDYKNLPFDDLRTLHREIGALIGQRRHEALEQLKQQIAVLGFNVDDLVPKKKRGAATGAKYRDPETPENVWSGRGKHPQWLREKLAQGHAVEEFSTATS